ncbi:MAG: glycosyltransferase, partial [Microcystis sp.]
MDWRQQLIIFTRYPESGKVKTRMIPALAAKGAEELHRK